MDSYSYLYKYVADADCVGWLYICVLKSISISALDDGVGAAGTEASAPHTTLMIRVKYPHIF